MRSTPWDAAIFGLATAEFQLMGSPPMQELESGLEALLTSGRYDLLYGRILPVSAIAKLLWAKGFFICETQVVLTLSERKYRAWGGRVSPIRVNWASDADYEAVTQGTEKLFQYSRFHEDPLILRECADQRMLRWICDLAKRRTRLLVSYSSTGQVIGFMFCKTGHEAELTLGGCLPEGSFLALHFWAGVVGALFEQGSRVVKVGVSAANVPMLRVYGELGFNVVSTAFDYHWHRQ